MILKNRFIFFQNKANNRK